jgi:hypothetical protein
VEKRIHSKRDFITVKEARLVLPNKSVHVTAIQAAIASVAAIFGGYTQYLGTGFWEGETEPVRILDIAMEKKRELEIALYDIADAFREATNQEAVYVRYPNGNVQLVTAQSCFDNGEKEEFDWDKFRADIHRDADALNDTIEVPEHVSIAP